MISQTQRALANRAIKCANLMEFWREQIKVEIEKQKLDFFGAETVALPMPLVSAMLSQMTPLVEEIRTFQRNLIRQKIRPKSI